MLSDLPLEGRSARRPQSGGRYLGLRFALQGLTSNFFQNGIDNGYVGQVVIKASCRARDFRLDLTSTAACSGTSAPHVEIWAASFRPIDLAFVGFANEQFCHAVVASR
jgi:hypothetical protein